MGGASAVFRDLADIFETIEMGESGDINYDITSITSCTDDLLKRDQIRIEFAARVPFPAAEETPDGMTLNPMEVRLTEEGSLEITVAATARTCDPPTTDSETETEELSDPSDTDETVERPSESSETDLGARRSAMNADASDSECGSENTDTADADTDRPAYRDPERLAAVYSEHDTFAEMTDALDVEVTPQTVRRYMIKHGIHEPASETGSRPAETLLNADPASISPTVHDELRADESSEDSDRESESEQRSSTDAPTRQRVSRIQSK